MKTNTCPLCGKNAEQTEEETVYYCYFCDTENWISEDSGVLFTNQSGKIEQHIV